MNTRELIKAADAISFDDFFYVRRLWPEILEYVQRALSVRDMATGHDLAHFILWNAGRIYGVRSERRESKKQA